MLSQHNWVEYGILILLHVLQLSFHLALLFSFPLVRFVAPWCFVVCCWSGLVLVRLVVVCWWWFLLARLVCSRLVLFVVGCTCGGIIVASSEGFRIASLSHEILLSFLAFMLL